LSLYQTWYLYYLKKIILDTQSQSQRMFIKMLLKSSKDPFTVLSFLLEENALNKIWLTIKSSVGVNINTACFKETLKYCLTLFNTF
jgi:hypothetical protein